MVAPACLVIFGSAVPPIAARVASPKPRNCCGKDDDAADLASESTPSYNSSSSWSQSPADGGVIVAPIGKGRGVNGHAEPHTPFTVDLRCSAEAIAVARMISSPRRFASIFRNITCPFLVGALCAMRACPRMGTGHREFGAPSCALAPPFPKEHSPSGGPSQKRGIAGRLKVRLNLRFGK